MADKNLQYFESTENNVNKEDSQNETENDQEKNLKSHSAEKLHKCNQCDYASSDSSNLRTHLKTHSGAKQIKKTFKNAQRRKVKQMQPV